MKKSAMLEIFDAMGALVYADNIKLDEQITVSKHDIRTLSNGIYLLRISGMELNETIKLIKK